MTGDGRHPDRVPMRDFPVGAPRKAREGEVVHRPDVPLPVEVWISQRQTGDFLALGEAVAWTAKQVEVTYSDPHGRTATVWVWAFAVGRRRPTP